MNMNLSEIYYYWIRRTKSINFLSFENRLWINHIEPCYNLIFFKVWMNPEKSYISTLDAPKIRPTYNKHVLLSDCIFSCCRCTCGCKLGVKLSPNLIMRKRSYINISVVDILWFASPCTQYISFTLLFLYIL